MLNKLKARLEVYVSNVKARSIENKIDSEEALLEYRRYKYGSQQLNELIKRSKYGLSHDPHFIDNHPDMKKQFNDAIDIVKSCKQEQAKAPKRDKNMSNIHPSVRDLF